jgi:hypothetical protein
MGDQPRLPRAGSSVLITSNPPMFVRRQITVLLLLLGCCIFFFRNRSHSEEPKLAVCAFKTYPDIQNQLAPVDQQMTFVLIVRLADLARTPMLLSSIQKFVESSLIYSFYWVIPDEEVSAFSQFAPNTRFPIYLIPESVLLNHTNPDPRKFHYHIQMMLKLSVASIVRTKFYLVFDSDIIVRRPTIWTNFFRDEKAFYNQDGQVYDMDPSHDELWFRWYNGGEKMLQVANSSLSTYKFGVTPAILATDISLSVIRRLEVLYPQYSWQDKLLRMEHPWSEYTLYRVMAHEAKTFDVYHTLGPDSPFYGKSSVWLKDGVQSWNASTAFESPDTGASFIVVQSSTNINPSDVWGRVAKYIS